MPEMRPQPEVYANLAGQSEMLDRRALRHFQTEFSRLKALRTPLEPDWRNDSRAYDMLPGLQFYQGRSDLRLPTISTLVERLVPRIVRATIGRDKFFHCVPVRSEDMEKAEINEALVRCQLEDSKFRRKYPLLVRDTVIYGTGIWKARWRYDVRPATGQVLFDGTDGDTVDIFNFWVDPRALDVEQSNVVEQMSMSYTDAKQHEAKGLFVGVDEAMKDATRATDSLSSDHSRRDRKHGWQESSLPAGHVWYREFWGEFALDAENEFAERTTETVQVVIGVLNGKVVRLGNNPHECQQKPYFKSVLLERTGEFYGISLVNKILPLWTEQNDARNQANDARSFAVCPVMFREPGTEDKKTSQRIFPGAILTGRGLQFAAFPDVTTPVRHWEPVMKRDMEEAIGAPSLLDAQSDAGSATEASIQQNESGVRIAAYAYSIEDVFLTRLLSFHHLMNKQFLTDRTAVRIKGLQGFDFRVVTATDVAGNYTFETLGASTMSRGASLTAQFLQTTDRMMVVEQTAPGTFDMEAWWSTYFRDVLDQPHPERFIKGLKFKGRVPSVDEVHQSLLEGKRVEPDPRQSFTDTLPEYAAYLNEIRDQLAQENPEVLKLFIAHFLDAEALAKQIIEERRRQQMEQMMMMAQLASGSNGGSSNAPVGDQDRDGKGLSTGRQLMKALPGGRG